MTFLLAVHGRSAPVLPEEQRERAAPRGEIVGVERAQHRIGLDTFVKVFNERVEERLPAYDFVQRCFVHVAWNLVRQSWLHPDAENRPTTAHGIGVFVTAPIPAGTTVAGFGGGVVDRRELEDMGELVRTHALQIDDDLYLASEPPFSPADYVNHSCDPNCGIVGAVLLVAMRDIAVGEELCFDYAMSDSDDYDEFDCTCGTALCRGVVRGSDWKRPELRVRYEGWYAEYLARRM